jgi:D-alanyl-lipoteichoic acid acyltransferase DltB (MBOAT superfamily)
MPFNSTDFLIFFLIAMAVYSVWPRRYRWAWLLAASYYFYASWALEYVAWLAAFTLIVYVLAILIDRVSVQARRKALLILGLVLLLGTLAVLKYLGFLSDSLQALAERFDWSYTAPVWRPLLPVGISFYTFQALGYLIDVYRGRIEPEKHLGILALFLFFFPQLVAGPIERAGHLLPQFRSRRNPCALDISGGLRLVLWGMFKKVVVADRLAVYVDAVFNHPADHRGLPIVLATVFFTIQIYCDFSGYTDIALGAARLMGYCLTGNLRQPYFSLSIVEFWRRWHVTLSTWFRDYLYIPLGGNRVPRWRWYTNVVVVFVLSGLWHGANWTFIVWGGLHAFYYLVDIWTLQVRAKVFGEKYTGRDPLRSALGMLATLGLVGFAWLFFRSNSISDALLLLNNVGQLGASTGLYDPWTGLGNNPGTTMVLALGMVAVWAVVELLNEYRWKRPLALWQKGWLRWIALLALGLAIMNLGVVKQTAFVYVQF